MIEIKVPPVGESISEVEIGSWLKAEGESATQDETLVMLDSAKTTVELPSPAAGVISKILKQQGEAATVGEVIGYIESGASQGANGGNGSTSSAAPQAETEETPAEPHAEKIEGEPKPEWQKPATANEKKDASQEQAIAPEAGSQSEAGSQAGQQTDKSSPAKQSKQATGDNGQPTSERQFVMPSADRVLHERGLEARQVQGSGPGGRMLKSDALNVQHRTDELPTSNQQMRSESAVAQTETLPSKIEAASVQTGAPSTPSPTADDRQPATENRQPIAADEEVVPMTMLRRHIAQRLVEAQQTAALLTTFNEVDMSATMAMRKELQDAFVKKYGIKLGFMSFFVKATVDALKQIPQINAEIRGKDMVFKNHYDIGVAIGSGKGLVVPVLRNAERLSFAEVEQGIADFATRVKENKLTPDELTGGTFTITNGGVFGSLLSTPIVNPPQSAILGMHTIQERPVARDGQVVIRPMMYVALTYDHRIVDGREAVQFLVRIKECIENPARMLMEV